MADVVANVELKYHIVKKEGNKEISQSHIKENICIGTIDEENLYILRWLVSLFFNDPETLLGDGDD